MADLTGPDRPDVVVISSLLDYSGWLAKRGETRRLLGKAEAAVMIRAGMERTVRRLADAGIASNIVRDTPRMTASMALCYSRGGGSAYDLTRERAQPKPWIDVEVALAFPTGSSVHLLNLTDQICEASHCRVERDGGVIGRDSHHVRASFALRQSEHFRRLLREVK